MRRSRNPRRAWAAALATLLVLAADCATVPVTGRSQLDLIPDGELNAMSLQQYGQFLKQHKLSRSEKDIELVRRVGGRIAGAGERYFAEKGDSQRVRGYKWEFNLVESKEANAWCMPGGKVVVYTGILPLTKDETGLAVVLGHEISHAVAKHGAERMSQGLLAELGGVALSVAVSDRPAETQNAFMTAYGAAAEYGALLPYSRVHETEADELGLVFMAVAGYDPNRAVSFWEDMKRAHGSQEPPVFLNTHPSSSERIQNIKNFLPKALKYYRPQP